MARVNASAPPPLASQKAKYHAPLIGGSLCGAASMPSWTTRPRRGSSNAALTRISWACGGGDAGDGVYAKSGGRRGTRPPGSAADRLCRGGGGAVRRGERALADEA